MFIGTFITGFAVLVGIPQSEAPRAVIPIPMQCVHVMDDLPIVFKSASEKITLSSKAWEAMKASADAGDFVSLDKLNAQRTQLKALAADHWKKWEREALRLGCVKR